MKRNVVAVSVLFLLFQILHVFMPAAAIPVHANTITGELYNQTYSQQQLSYTISGVTMAEHVIEDQYLAMRSSLTGAVRVGDTITIQASATSQAHPAGGSSQFTRAFLSSDLQIKPYFSSDRDKPEFERKMEEIEIAEGATESHSLSFTVPPGTQSVYCQINTTTGWQNVNGGFSDSLFVAIHLEVLEEEEEQPTQPEPAIPEQTSQEIHTDVRPLELRGLVRSVENKPMPWMKLEANIFTGVTEYADGMSPDLVVTGVTDHLGRYQIDIPPIYEDGQSVGILLVGSLECVNPFENNRTLFTMIDVKDRISSNIGQISLASWLVVDADELRVERNEAVASEPLEPILLHRLLAYYHLGLGTWSFDEMMDPDPVIYFSQAVADETAEQEQARWLEGFSALYTTVFDAWFFGGVILNEIDRMMDKPVSILLRYESSASEFNRVDNQIRMTPLSSKRDDYSRFVMLHEFGHYFDYASNPGGTFRAEYGLSSTDVPHDGYLNASTADSYIEGFATAFAGMVQLYSGYSSPEITGTFNLSGAGLYFPWTYNGGDEELAIASLLYQSQFQFDTIRDYWAVLSVDRLNFYEYYLAIESALDRGSKREWLRDYAIDSGLFKMPFGNGRYDPGEPYLDLASNESDQGNGWYDAGEPFADLMFATDSSGRIDMDQPIRSYNRDDLIAGKSSPANTPDGTPRYSLPDRALQLQLQGDVPEFVVLQIQPRSSGRSLVSAYAVVLPVDENLVQFDVPPGLDFGQAAITTLEGAQIWSEDIHVLQQIREEQAGSSKIEPLASARVRASETISESNRQQKAGVEPIQVVSAVYGSAEKSPLLEIEMMPQDELIRLADAKDHRITLTGVADQLAQRQDGRMGNVRSNPERVDTSSARTWLIILLVAFMVVMALLLVFLITRYKQNPVSQTQTGTQRYLPRQQPSHEFKGTFCPHCGARQDLPGEHCMNCGKKREEWL